MQVSQACKSRRCAALTGMQLSQACRSRRCAALIWHTYHRRAALIGHASHRVSDFENEKSWKKIVFGKTSLLYTQPYHYDFWVTLKAARRNFFSKVDVKPRKQQFANPELSIDRHGR